MIQIYFHKKFQKSYLKRIKSNKKLVEVFNRRVEQFSINPDCRQLHNHQLIGKLKNTFSFSINGDIRCLYYWINENEVLFLDIGSHNQVY